MSHNQTLLKMHKFFYSNQRDQSDDGEEKRRTRSESSEDDGVEPRKDSLDIPLRVPTRKRILSASRVMAMGGAYHRSGRGSKSKDVIRRWNSFHSTRAYECHPNRFKNPRRNKSPFRNLAVQSVFENRKIPLIDDDVTDETINDDGDVLPENDDYIDNTETSGAAATKDETEKVIIEDEDQHELVDTADEPLMRIVENQEQTDKTEIMSTPSKSWALRRGHSLADRLQPLPTSPAASQRRLSWYVIEIEIDVVHFNLISCMSSMKSSVRFDQFLTVNVCFDVAP